MKKEYLRNYFHNLRYTRNVVAVAVKMGVSRKLYIIENMSK